MRVESIVANGALLATVVKNGVSPAETTFVTENHCPQQLGFVVRPAGDAVLPHSHAPVRRRLVGTSEVLVVREGLCELDLYTADGELVRTCRLEVGDVVLLMEGGHGLRMIERTVLLEIKQGPYSGAEEKVMLQPTAAAKQLM